MKSHMVLEPPLRIFRALVHGGFVGVLPVCMRQFDSCSAAPRDAQDPIWWMVIYDNVIVNGDRRWWTWVIGICGDRDDHCIPSPHMMWAWSCYVWPHVWASSAMSMYDLHMLSAYVIIARDKHIWWSPVIIVYCQVCDSHRWSTWVFIIRKEHRCFLHTVRLYGDHCWSSRMMDIDGDSMWTSNVVVLHDWHTWFPCVVLIYADDVQSLFMIILYN